MNQSKIDETIHQIENVLFEEPLKYKFIYIWLFLKGFFDFTEKSKYALFIGYLLKRSGWQRLGEGQYAIVYQSPCKSFALRISSSSDDQYAYFAFNALSNPDISYFPNIFFQISTIKHKLNITLLENLQKVKVIRKHGGIELFIKAFPSCFSGCRAKSFPRNQSVEFQRAVSVLDQTMKDFGLMVDLNLGNFMTRNTENTVLIDAYFTLND